MELRLHAHGAADPDVVWERYARPALWPTWSPQIRHVRSSTERIAVGTTGEVVGPLGVTVHFVISSVDETRRVWFWRVTFGPVTVGLEHGVEAAADGTTTTLRMTGPGPVLLGYAGVARWALGRLVRPD